MQVAHFVCAAWAHTLCEPFSSGNNYLKEETNMKHKIVSSFTRGFTVIPFLTEVFKATITQNQEFFCSLYLGVVLFLIFEFAISAFELSKEFFSILPILLAMIIPIIAIKKDLIKVRLRKRKINRIKRKINRLNSKLDYLEYK